MQSTAILLLNNMNVNFHLDDVKESFVQQCLLVFSWMNKGNNKITVPSQGHYGFHSFPVVDWFCLFIYLWVLTFPLEDCSEFGNFVITLYCVITITIHLVPFQLCSDCHLHFGKIPNGFFSRNNLTTNVPFCHLQKFMPLYFCDSYYTIKGNNNVKLKNIIILRNSTITG
jgi:hypothetical protein